MAFHIDVRYNRFSLQVGVSSLSKCWCCPYDVVCNREPHVGLDVCVPAFESAPSYMRERLSQLTNGTRLLGGSADTLYIPQRYKSDFLHVLGIFLETDCFLEIAVPTTVHLVVQPDDVIQYVDHVCGELFLICTCSQAFNSSGGSGNHLST